MHQGISGTFMGFPFYSSVAYIVMYMRRISMPEPHQSLGVIKGVIIRDAQGNIGLTSYTFSPFTYT